MKIAILRHSIRNWGADRIVFTYARHLIQQGHEVDYYVNKLMTTFPVPEGVVMKKIPYPGVAGTLAFTLLHPIQADLVLVDLAVMAFFRRPLHPRETLCLLAQDNDVSYYRSPLLKAWTRFCYRVVLGKWQIPLLSEAEGLTEELRQYGPTWVRTIPNGTDVEAFHKPVNAGTVTRKEPCAVLYFSRADFRKGRDVAEAVFGRLAADLPAEAFELWVIGESMRIEGVSIVNLGFLSGDAYVEVLQKAGIYLMTSRSEGLSTLLLDAMACRCAVVATKAATMLTHGEDALVSEIDDVEGLLRNLQTLITRPEERARLAAGAFEAVRRFDVRLSCAKFEQGLEEARAYAEAGRIRRPPR